MHGLYSYHSSFKLTIIYVSLIKYISMSLTKSNWPIPLTLIEW